MSSEFRVCGLSLRGDAMREVCAFLQQQPDVDAALARLLTALEAVNRAHSLLLWWCLPCAC